MEQMAGIRFIGRWKCVRFGFMGTVEIPQGTNNKVGVPLVDGA